jgi:hypothetical protein
LTPVDVISAIIVDDGRLAFVTISYPWDLFVTMHDYCDYIICSGIPLLMNTWYGILYYTLRAFRYRLFFDFVLPIAVTGYI